jgi:hypothetical protein
MNTMSDDWEEARKYATWKPMLSEELTFGCVKSTHGPVIHFLLREFHAYLE